MKKERSSNPKTKSCSKSKPIYYHKVEIKACEETRRRDENSVLNHQNISSLEAGGSKGFRQCPALIIFHADHQKNSAEQISGQLSFSKGRQRYLQTCWKIEGKEQLRIHHRVIEARKPKGSHPCLSKGPWTYQSYVHWGDKDNPICNSMNKGWQ